MSPESGAKVILTVAPFALAMAMSPGPNNLIIAAIASRFGVRRTIPYLLGTVVGISALLIAVGSGLGELFVRWPTLHSWMKVAGTGYLLWLAWRIATTMVSNDASADRPFGFATGLAFQWLNPKAWMMAIGAFSVFSTTSGGPRPEVLLITLTVAMAFVPAAALWTMVGLTARRLLVSNKAIASFNIVMALLLVGSVATVLF